MKESMFDLKKLFLLRKVYNKFLNENSKTENFSSSYAVFAEALSKRTFNSQQELTDYVGCNKAHTSRTLFKMQIKGLIRPICAKSGANVFNLTEKGKLLAENAEKNKQKLMKDLFENIKDDEIEVFLNVLDQIITNAKVIEGN